DSLPGEIIIHYLFPLLSDYGRLQLISLNKHLRTLQSDIYFCQQHEVYQATRIEWYFDKLRNVLATSIYTLPPRVEKIQFRDCFSQNIKGWIPSTVTHLTFGKKYNKDLRGCIPEGI